MTTPTLSLIISTYNRCGLLERTLHLEYQVEARAVEVVESPCESLLGVWQQSPYRMLVTHDIDFPEQSFHRPPVDEGRERDHLREEVLDSLRLGRARADRVSSLLKDHPQP